MAKSIKDKITETMGSSFYSITSDGWSNPSRSPQLQSITVHVVDEQFTRKDMVLAAFPMDEFRHTGENISCKIGHYLADNGLLQWIILSGEDALLKRIQLRLISFRAIEKPPYNANIFEWWKDNGAQFPDLVPFSKIFLSIPATSVSSERLFSKASLIYSNTLRNRLSGQRAENILIIKANLNVLELVPSAELDMEDDEKSSDELQELEKDDI